MKELVFRDDDIGYLTNFNQFKKVHEIFNEYNCTHTIAMLTKNITKAPELVEYIKANKNIDVQVHSFQHINCVAASDGEIRYQLKMSIDIIQNVFEKIPTVFYPPFNFWNSIDQRVIDLATECGLKTSWEKAGLLYYIKHNGNIIQDTLNFHYFDDGESILIEPVLKHYTERKKK